MLSSSLVSRTKTSSRSLGKRAEDLAVKYLKRHAYFIIDRNWKCSIGEIDIITSRAGRLVFVEVKGRKFSSTWIEDAFNSVDHTKQDKIKNLAGIYLSKNLKKLKRKGIRKFGFDVIAVGLKPFNSEIVHSRGRSFFDGF